MPLHLRHSSATGGPRSFQIQIDSSIPNFLAHLIDGSAFPNAGVANQKVDAIELSGGRIDQPLGIALERNICLNCQPADTAGFGFTYDLLRGVFIAHVIGNDVRAEPGKAFHRGAPDASRPAGDQSNPAF